MRLNHRFDPRLYLVAQADQTAGRDVVQTVLAAVRGGVTLVQLREKSASTREFFALAAALKTALDPLGIPLLVNDRADVALAARAAGLHIGQSDLPYPEARRLMGPDAIIGLSLDSLDDARKSETFAGLDYASCGPIFATRTKADAGEALGFGPESGLAAYRRIVTRPLVAIGGIGLDSAAACRRAGADGIAVVSAVLAAPDPEAAARGLRQAFDV